MAAVAALAIKKGGWRSGERQKTLYYAAPRTIASRNGSGASIMKERRKMAAAL